MSANGALQFHSHEFHVRATLGSRSSDHQAQVGTWHDLCMTWNVHHGFHLSTLHFISIIPWQGQCHFHVTDFFRPNPSLLSCPMDDSSFQDLLAPLTEIAFTLCRLRDLRWRINEMIDLLDQPAADAMRQASQQVSAAISHYETLQWHHQLALRASLQAFLRQYGRLPNIDVFGRHGGWRGGLKKMGTKVFQRMNTDKCLVPSREAVNEEYAQFMIQFFIRMLKKSECGFPSSLALMFRSYRHMMWNSYFSWFYRNWSAWRFKTNNYFNFWSWKCRANLKGLGLTKFSIPFLPRENVLGLTKFFSWIFRRGNPGEKIAKDLDPPSLHFH